LLWLIVGWCFMNWIFKFSSWFCIFPCDKF
jgi:hypothetical protein